MTTFEQTGSREIPSLQATVEEYIEPSTGARHVHLASDQAEMVFLVAFPTVPDVSDGRAHVLEHLALCGSERYPVRDPFFAMMRRSTATFMNAFTYADRTVYPFASTDKQDFFNLLDVYLDATFFPKLDYLNFLQEGWRHVLKDGKLSYQGVVFNEMKGAFNDPMRALYSGIGSALLEGTTYEVESGGDPLVIPELTHAMLQEFHASHYHPSQAVFMTSGAIGAAEIQEQIQKRVLSRLSGRYARLRPQLAPSWSAPRENEVRIPSQTARDDEFGLQFSWVLGESVSLDVYYNAYLLSAGLLGDSSAPLTKAMESAGYGRPSRLNGHDDSARQMIFHLGMEGLTEAQIAQAHARIWAALERTAVEGVPLETLQAAIRDVRYSQRDTASGRMPNALTRLLHAVPVAMRDGNVVDALDGEAHLAKLEVAIQDPAYFKGLVRFLLDTPNRLTTRVVPDAAYFSGRAAEEEAGLAAREAALSDAERARIETETAALDAHQALPSDSAVLPRIRPGDVSPHPRPSLPLPALSATVLPFAIPSNGLSYARTLYNVSAFEPADWPWLHLYTDLIGELGVGDMDYEQAGAWRQRMVPSLNVGLDSVQARDGGLSLQLWFAASGLREEHQNIAEVLSRCIAEARFDEHERLAFLIDSQVQESLNQLAQSGNRYAMLSATAPLSSLRRFEDEISGVAALPFYGQLLQQVKTPEGIAAIAERLSGLHRRIIALTPTVLSAGAGDDGADLGHRLRLPAESANGAANAGDAAAAPRAALPLQNAALHAVSQINHCVTAWRAPMLHEAGAAALAVAAELMTNQLLHPALREKGGAYGGNASYAGGTGIFSMSSYRDPRLAETYADFGLAIDQMLDSQFSQEELEEAIICVIKGLDKPQSPYDQVLYAWSLHQRGIDPVLRQRFRSEVLTCTLDDIKSVVRRYLKEGTPSRAAFAGNLTQELSGLEAVDLLALATAA